MVVFCIPQMPGSDTRACKCRRFHWPNLSRTRLIIVQRHSNHLKHQLYGAEKAIVHRETNQNVFMQHTPHL